MARLGLSSLTTDSHSHNAWVGIMQADGCHATHELHAEMLAYIQPVGS